MPTTLIEAMAAPIDRQRTPACAAGGGVSLTSSVVDGGLAIFVAFG
jgi:hypothetical protein